MTDIQETSLRFSQIGAKGDAVAHLETPDGERLIHAAFALPGEIFSAAMLGDKAQLLDRLETSPERIEPVCVHFGICGGCALQHWQEEPYLAWKGALVSRALQRKGIEIDVGPAIAAWGRGRRRAGFHAKLGPTGDPHDVVFGFSEAKSHRIEAITMCPVLTPNLQAALPALKALAGGLAPKNETITLAVTDTAAGLDVDIRGAGHVDRFERRGLERLAALVETAGLARLTLHGEPALVRATPRVKIGPAIVELPPGAFLQATNAGENELAECVLEWTKGAKRVADLFAGLGTFALRLKETAQVRAIESDPASVAAMKKAADGLAGGRTLVAEVRDLFRAPLAPLEMKGLDAIVFDPPRAGAEAQAQQIARSQIKTIVAISCDPTSFARDAHIMIDGGYQLKSIKAFDQFRFTPHVEIAALFTRPKSSR